MRTSPLKNSLCNPREIWRMVDEMLVAERQWLPQYASAAAEAQKRLDNPG
jgi:alpha-galactosidase